MMRKFIIYNLQCTIKLILLLFTFYILHFTFYITPVHAQTPPPSSFPASSIQPQDPASSFQLPASISPTSPVYTDLLVHNMFHTFSCLAAGQSVIGQPCLTYRLTQNATGAISGVPVLSSANLSGGLLGTTTGLIAGLYANPPVRTADYLASLRQGFGVVREANAQVGGSGAQVLSPIISLWQVSRNIAYLVMIIIFVAIGLMVMFRNRINPQTVITAQAALPGLVIGLIMITFSYFLAGLVSDTAFVGTNLVGAYFSAVTGKTQNLVDDLRDKNGDKNVLKLFTPFTRIVNRGDVQNAVHSIWDDLADPNFNALQRANPFEPDPQKVLTNLAVFIAVQFALPLASLLGGPGQIAVGLPLVGLVAKEPEFVVSFAISFIAMLILIYAMFQLLLRLINAYISIIFLTFTAPFQFLAAALPGRQSIATHWILRMLANVLAFPAVLAVFYFVAFLLGPNLADYCPPATCPFKISQRSPAEYNTLIPVANAAGTTLAGENTFPLFGGMSVEFINLLLAFGALVALPKIPDLVAKAIGGLSEAGQLIGQEIGSSTRAGRGYADQFSQGTSGLAGQAGRLTSTTGEQIVVNPRYGQTPGEPKYTTIPSVQPGQIERARFGWGRFWGGGGLGGKIKSRFGL